MKNLVIVAGPTASGKTDLGIDLAQKLNGEIISADSMQIYKYMNVGSAKPSQEEMRGIPHHMIDVVYPHEEFSVALFREMAGKCIDDITSRGKLPIVAGGTGLYINSLTYRLDFTKTPEDTEYRDSLKNIAVQNGNEYLHSMLKDIDPDSFKRLHSNDVKRIIRALEVYKNTGKTITQYQLESRQQEIEYNIAYIGLTMERQKLYERINRRVDKMFDMGLVEEVKVLRKMGYNRNMTSMQGIGYKEIFDYLDGLYSFEELEDVIKQNTRRYAKRQLTWFRREERVYWINIDEFENHGEMLENILKYIEGKLNLV